MKKIDVVGPAISQAASNKRPEHATRLLFVEDDQVYFSLLKRIMESVKDAAFEIFWASTLERGLEMLKNERVDVILLDLMLPDSDGLETFRRVFEKAGGTPIIVLSGLNDEQQAMDAVYLGAQDFLIKGKVGVDSLIRCIRYTLARLQVAEYRERLQAITDFTAALAHDLRGPIIGAERVLTSMLSRSTDQLSAEDLTMLRILKGNNDFLRKKVDALLEIYRLESDSQTLEVESLDFSSIVQTCIQNLTTDAENLDRKIIYKTRRGVQINGNRNALLQLCTNLLDNAIKFSAPGGLIEVAINYSGENIKLTVHDYGPGIAVDDLQFLFKKFWRGGSHHFVPGTGLGLYLCEKIVRFHGGSISCESTLGAGTTFVVLLPSQRKKTSGQRPVLVRSERPS